MRISTSPLAFRIWRRPSVFRKCTLPRNFGWRPDIDRTTIFAIGASKARKRYCRARTCRFLRSHLQPASGRNRISRPYSSALQEKPPPVGGVTDGIERAVSKGGPKLHDHYGSHGRTREIADHCPVHRTIRGVTLQLSLGDKPMTRTTMYNWKSL
jgi:hypothetical protein